MDEQIKWTRPENMYRIYDAWNALKQQEELEKLKEADVVVTMMGLNEIRDGDTAERIAEEYEQLISKISHVTQGKPIIIVGTPPVTDRAHKFEAEELNDVKH